MMCVRSNAFNDTSCYNERLGRREDVVRMLLVVLMSDKDTRFTSILKITWIRLLLTSLHRGTPRRAARRSSALRTVDERHAENFRLIARLFFSVIFLFRLHHAAAISWMWRLSGSIRHSTRTLRLASVRRVDHTTAGPRSLQSTSRCREVGIRRFGSAPVLRQDAETTSATPVPPSSVAIERNANLEFANTLPVVCPGCGALSQTVDPDVPGFYSQKQRAKKRNQKQHEDDVFQQAMARLSSSETSQAVAKPPQEGDDSIPTRAICDRCHELVHQSRGQSILHPSMESIRDIIESSPHKNNHIYHVLDAADFPLSLIPNLMSTLKLPRLRTQNRRSKSDRYIRGRAADVSFIVTRSDLLAPKKEQVDQKMHYLQEVLRDALGKTGKNVRLSNVRCVSAKRGWWTPAVKQEIWKRGGAGWVVGKVNVGKSALFEVVFPKGRNDVAVEDARIKAMREAGSSDAEIEQARIAHQVSDEARNRIFPEAQSEPDAQAAAAAEIQDQTAEVASNPEQLQNEEATAEDEAEDLEDFDDLDLLPPAQPETKYPQMPVVSALPGTTASPIRIPYGNGKGELIDLPGVQRSSLETHVEPQHRSSLVMKSRVVPEQHTIKPGGSLLLGGIIRITPKTDDLIFLACPFTPLKPHVSNTEKAKAIQTGVHEDGTVYTGSVESIATKKAKSRMKSAGTFKLEWDVTKARAGPMTDKTAGKQKAENLPFIVYGADILIEGVGWVEITCQVRSRRKSLISDALSAQFGDDGTPNVDVTPEVEIFTPKGKFIGIRKPMNAWLLGGPNKVAKHKQRPRPRMTISMKKRKEGGKQAVHG